MLQPIIERITYPFWQWYNGYTDLPILGELLRSERLSRKDLKKLQFDKLKKLLIHAGRTVPFYKKRFKDCGFSPEFFSDMADLKKIPILHKGEINNNETLLSSEFKESSLEAGSTGGSTGTPLKFYHSLEKTSYIRAATLRENSWLGCRVGDKVARFWGSGKDMHGISSLKARVGNSLVRRTLFLNAYKLDEKRIKDFIKTINSFQPKIIISYATVAYWVAKYARRYSITPFSPHFLVSTAETLHDDHRALIEEVFRTKVINRYASRELGQVASGCGQSEGLHINEDCLYVEVLPLDDRGSSSDSGRIIVTDLTNFAQPMIRYDTEDVGIMDENFCSCKLPFSKFRSINGRKEDLFVTLDGKYIYGGFFTHLFLGIPGVKRLQFIQERINLIRVYIVKDEKFLMGNLAGVEKAIRNKMGENVSVEFLFPESIDHSISGKHRYTISKVKIDDWSGNSNMMQDDLEDAEVSGKSDEKR